LEAKTTENGEILNVNLLADIKRRMIKEFLDLIILSIISKRPCSGYDIMRYVLSKYNILLSSGTVYSNLYALEREHLLTGWWCGRKRIYKLDIKGQNYIKQYEKHLQLIHKFTYEFFNIVRKGNKTIK